MSSLSWDRAADIHYRRINGIKRSINNCLELATMTDQQVDSSPEQLFEDAIKLEEEAAKVGWRGLLYVQLHLGNIAIHSNEDFVIPCKDRKLIISPDSGIWDSLGPRDYTYGSEEIDALKDSSDFEPHVRLAILNSEGGIGHCGQMPFDREGDSIVSTYAKIERDLVVIKPSLNVGALNFMGILALCTAGYTKDLKYDQTETIVPIIEARKSLSGQAIGTVTLGSKGGVLLSEYNGKPWVYDEQIGIGLSVGLTG